jgi:hypothetical protein
VVGEGIHASLTALDKLMTDRTDITLYFLGLKWRLMGSLQLVDIRLFLQENGVVILHDHALVN